VKACPFCAEYIRDDAIKCRYCGSNLVDDDDSKIAKAKDLLDTVAETSKNARTVFFAQLSLSLYALVTIFGTSDEVFLTLTKRLELPIVHVELPIKFFFIVGPLLTLAITVYLFYYVQHLRDLLAELKRYNPPSRGWSKVIYPWLVSIASVDDPDESRWKILYRTVRSWLVGFSLWWLPVIVLWAYMWKHSAMHSREPMLYHGALLGLAATISLIAAWKNPLPKYRRKHVVAIVKFVFTFLWAATITIGGSIIYNQVNNNYLSWEDSQFQYEKSSLLKILLHPKNIYIRGAKLSSYLSEVELQARYANLKTELKLEGREVKIPNKILQERAKSIFGLQVPGRHLEGATLSHTNLAKANLSGAYLTKANLNGTNLLWADLKDANLIEASLVNTNLLEADLTRANFNGANLTHADLSRAKVEGTIFDTANLKKTDLSGAELSGTQFYKAILNEADLTHVKIYSGANFGKAKFRRTNFRGRGAIPVDPENTIFTGAMADGETLASLGWTPKQWRERGGVYGEWVRDEEKDEWVFVEIKAGEE